MAAKKYAREVILALTEFKGYQEDFLKVILDKPCYSLSEARKIVSEFFKEDNNGRRNI